MKHRASISTFLFFITFLPCLSIQSQTNPTKDHSLLEKFFTEAQNLRSHGNNKIALQLYKHVLTIDPTHIASLINAATILYEQNRYAKALSYYLRAGAINENSIANVHDNISTCFEHIAQFCKNNNEFDHALTYYKKALHYTPTKASTLHEAGNCLALLNQYEQALSFYMHALKTNPHLYSAIHNFGHCLKKLGRAQEATQIFEYLITLKPDYTLARFSAALSYLMLGNLKQGFAEYEWRWAAFDEEEPAFDCMIWSGQDLHNKKILVHAEQGLGDTYQFMRYLKLLKDQGAYIIFKVQNPLKTIISLVPYIDEVISYNQNSPATDYAVSLMSLPYIFKTEVTSIPADTPYLYADQALVELWKPIIKAENSFNIGICFQGNAHYSTQALQEEVAKKSLHVSFFEPLAQLQGVRLFSLQKKDGEEQMHDLSFPIHQFDENFDTIHGRFMDTAAVMKNLDLIITVDTSIAHLAGGLGVPVWILLPMPADWRWMLDRTDTPWYPTVRLFRQSTTQNWQEVIATVVAELAKRNTQNT